MISSFSSKSMGIRRGYKGVGRAPVPLPLELWGRGQGATIWLNSCKNSLKASLKYIKITLKVYFYFFFNLALALIEFFRARIHKNKDHLKGGPEGGHEIFAHFVRKFTEHWFLAPPPWENPVSAPDGYVLFYINLLQ